MVYNTLTWNSWEQQQRQDILNWLVFSWKISQEIVSILGQFSIPQLKDWTTRNQWKKVDDQRVLALQSWYNQLVESIRWIVDDCVHNEYLFSIWLEDLFRIVEYKAKIKSLERELGKEIEVFVISDEEYHSWVNSERKFISDSIGFIYETLNKESSASYEYAQESFQNLITFCNNLVRVIDLQNPRDRLNDEDWKIKQVITIAQKYYDNPVKYLQEIQSILPLLKQFRFNGF
jgi:hypothetical protein